MFSTAVLTLVSRLSRDATRDRRAEWPLSSVLQLPRCLSVAFSYLGMNFDFYPEVFIYKKMNSCVGHEMFGLICERVSRSRGALEKISVGMGFF